MAGQQFISFVNGFRKLITATQVGGSGSANLIPALNASGLFDQTMMPSGVGPSTAVVLASEAISAGAIVNLYPNSGVINARNADNTNTSRYVTGFTLAAITSGVTGTIYFNGIITGLTGLTPGALYYLGTVGGIILASSLPTATGTLLQAVGQAISSTTLQFAPDDILSQ